MKKPPDRVREEFVRRWLQRAEEDLNAAKSLSTYGSTFLTTVCFHAQQAAEKYLKAFLTQRQVEFRKTHDLAELLDLIAPIDATLSESLRATVGLTDYAVDVRYPGDLPAVTVTEAREAVQLAEKTRAQVLKSL